MNCIEIICCIDHGQLIHMLLAVYLQLLSMINFIIAVIGFCNIYVSKKLFNIACRDEERVVWKVRCIVGDEVDSWTVGWTWGTKLASKY